MRKYPRWIQALDRPLLHYLQRVVARATNLRYFNGSAIRVPWDLVRGWQPFHNYIYEVEEWEAVCKFGRSGETFLDIGANIGIITVAMSSVAGKDGHVIAFEPNPQAYRLLLNTLSVNQCCNVLPLQVLVLDKVGISTFNISSVDSLGVRSSVAYKDTGGETVRVPAITIDSFIEDASKLDYFKIDAEGAEMRILTGARQTLQSCRPLVQVEVHGQYMIKIGDTVEALFAFMEQNVYECINLPTMERIEASEFLRCTHCHAPDAFTGEDMAFHGYGQILFVPRERVDILQRLTPRECKVCQIK